MVRFGRRRSRPGDVLSVPRAPRDASDIVRGVDERLHPLERLCLSHSNCPRLRHARRRVASPNQLDEALRQMLVVSWASLFLASELSYPLWLIDTPLRLVQFPHRFIYVTSATGLVANLLALWNLQRCGATAVRRLLTALPLVLGFALTGLMSCKLVFMDGKPLHLSVDETKPYRGLSEYR